MPVKIHVYTICWNAEKIIPYFLRHYTQFADKIFVYDNQSTDSTPEIVRNFEKATLISFGTNNTFTDRVHINIKNSEYRKSLGIADYVIVVDIDEFLYHPNILGLLSNYNMSNPKVTFPKVFGYQMVSFFHPTTRKPIYSQINLGQRSQFYANKRCIFDPSIDINYEPGSHVCNPKGVINESAFADLKLLHYHHIGLINTIKKHKKCKQRLSEENKIMGWGRHYMRSSLVIVFEFLLLYSKSQVIINRENLSIFQTIKYLFIRTACWLITLWFHIMRGGWMPIFIFDCFKQ